MDGHEVANEGSTTTSPWRPLNCSRRVNTREEIRTTSRRSASLRSAAATRLIRIPLAIRGARERARDARMRGRGFELQSLRSVTAFESAPAPVSRSPDSLYSSTVASRSSRSRVIPRAQHAANTGTIRVPRLRPLTGVHGCLFGESPSLHEETTFLTSGQGE